MPAKFVVMLTKFSKYQENDVLEIIEEGVDWVRLRKSGIIVFKDFVKIVGL